MNAPLLHLSCLAVLVTLAVPSLARAATFQVPSAQHPTIQAGIDAAQSGDTVLVTDGTYRGDGNRDLDFKGKSLTVKSLHGAAKTIIDCQGSAAKQHRGFFVHHGELAVAIDGFTVEHGYTASNTAYGGGAFIDSNGDVAVRNCAFNGNTARGNTANGGGAYINCSSYGDVVVTNCTFSSNTASGTIRGYGGGAYIKTNGTGGVEVTNCALSGNTASGNTANGGGVYIYSHNSSVEMINCTSSGNAASSTTQGGSHGGGAYLESHGHVAVTNCIGWGDKAEKSPLTAEFTSSPPHSIIFTNNDIQGGALSTGNINVDPLFVNAAKGDLHLKPGSPCLGAGASNVAPATDLDGKRRPNPPSMGAYDVAAPPGSPGYIVPD